jgi:TRAP-type C4-dicarboxylate transport system substrate-binding protein
MSIARRSVLSFALVAAAMMLTPPASAAEVTLRFGTLDPNADTPMHRDILAPWAEQIEKDSGGRIAIKIGLLNEFAKPADYGPMVLHGELDMAYVVLGYTPELFPNSSVMELPLIYPDSVSGSRAFWKLYKEGLLAKDFANVKVAGLFVLPPFGIFTVNRNFTSLRDLRGLRMRTPSATVGLALARLGAIPIGIPVNALGENIGNGTLDATAFGWDILSTTAGFGDKKTLQDQVKYLIDANFAAPSLGVLMNKAKYEAMPEDLRQILDAHTGADFSLTLAKFREVSVAAAKERLRQDPAHVVIALTPEQREEMKKIVAPVVADWAANLKKQGIDADRLLARARELVSSAATTN